MYRPPVFAEERTEILQELIRAHPFATLVTLGPEGLTADHVPMILHADVGEHGVLRCHVARPNPVWKGFDAEAGALAIFQGPHHYVSPGWYPSKAEHGKAVPTWNYCVVHVRGQLSAVEDPARIRAHLDALTAMHEAHRSEPWAPSDAPEDYIEKMIGGLVGFELRISELHGKWKMSQNRGEADRAGVRDGLSREATASASGVAKLVP